MQTILDNNAGIFLTPEVLNKQSQYTRPDFFTLLPAPSAPGSLECNSTCYNSSKDFKDIINLETLKKNDFFLPNNSVTDFAGKHNLVLMDQVTTYAQLLSLDFNIAGERYTPIEAYNIGFNHAISSNLPECEDLHTEHKRKCGKHFATQGYAHGLNNYYNIPLEEYKDSPLSYKLFISGFKDGLKESLMHNCDIQKDFSEKEMLFDCNGVDALNITHYILFLTEGLEKNYEGFLPMAYSEIITSV